MTIPVTQFADSSSGLGSLGIDGKALVIQLVTFLLAFWVLQHWAFKPIVRLMNQRRQTIEDGVSLGEQMRKDKAELDTKVSAELAKARGQADGIIAEAQDTACESVRAAESQALEKAEGIVAEAMERTKQDVARARKQLESEIVSLISDATEAIIDEKIDAKKDAGLIDKALKEQVRA